MLTSHLPEFPLIAEEPSDGLHELILAGGCFWCVEGVFARVMGVISAQSGYVGGSKNQANYHDVCTGTTGHAEAVRLTYEAASVRLSSLLKIFFAIAHDPTQWHRQGNDRGSQYRSALFYQHAHEQQWFEQYLAALNRCQLFEAQVVTTIEPCTEFFPAEDYHQNYVSCNPFQPYVRGVALPKIAALEQYFPDLLKTRS